MGMSQNPPVTPAGLATAPIDLTHATPDSAGYYAVYEEHARTLRTWLVAYGIGGPVLILSQEAVWKQITKIGSLPLIAKLFLGGVVLQVVLAAVNKSAMWALYCGEVDREYAKTKRYKVGSWLSERYIIDLALDLSSMVLFAWATYECFVAFTAV
jgi:hypothetical protein